MKLNNEAKSSKATIAVQKLEQYEGNYMTKREASEITGMAASTIWTLCKKGKIRTNEIYTRSTIFKDDLIAYLKRSIPKNSQ